MSTSLRFAALCSLALAAVAVSCGDDGDPGGDPNTAGKGGSAGNRGGSSGASGSSGKGGTTGGTSSAGRGGGGTGGASGEGGDAGSGVGAEGGESGSAGTASGAGGQGGEDGGAGGEGGASCQPTEPPDEVCDDVDNDCNGEVDDIDTGGDGIRDCLTIVLVGAPGTQPSSNFQQWLADQGTDVTRIHNTGTPAELTSGDLAPYDVAIVDYLVRDYTATESETLAAWVAAGGGLMSMNGHNGSSDLTWGNSLLAELGVEHVAGLRSGAITIFSTHPLTTGLTSVTFQGGYRLADLPGGAGSTVVAEYSDGPVGLALERGNGRAFIWGDEWVQFDSQWQALPEIQQFWVNALGWLSRAN